MRALAVCCFSICFVPSLSLATPDTTLDSSDLPAPQSVSAIADAASLEMEGLPERVRTGIKMTVIERAQAARGYATHAISRDEICNTMAKAAQEHDLPVAFFTSLIWQESAFRPQAVSPVGAQGVAQFMPWVAARMGLDNPFDPREALPMSAKLLRTLVEQFKNFGLAAAAYNAGPTRIVNWMEKRGKLPKETRDYVQTITGRSADQWRKAKTARYEFKAPARTRCDIVVSRPAADGSGFTDVANIPLPPARPDRAIALAQVRETTGQGSGDHREMRLASAYADEATALTQNLPPVITNAMPRARPVPMGGPFVPVKDERVVAKKPFVADARTTRAAKAVPSAIAKIASAKTARKKAVVAADARVKNKPLSIAPAAKKQQIDKAKSRVRVAGR